MKRASLPVVAILLAGLLLSACGPAAAVPPRVLPLPEATQPPQAAGIAVTDALDRTVEFPALPQRIVVAGKSTLTIIDTMYLFPEARDRVIGLSVGKQPVGDFLSLVDPEFDQKKILEPETGPEQIAPLKPDVVVMRSMMAGTLGSGLEQIGIPVVYVDLETTDQYFRDVATLGQLLGDEQRAGEIAAFYHARLDSIAQQQGQLPEGQEPSVLLVQYSEQGGEVALNVPSTSWLQTAEVEMAGGDPVWREASQGGGWTVVNFEQIAAWNPDKILVVSYSSDSAAVVEQLRNDDQWRGLKAVRSGQIYGFPGDIFSWDQPDPRWILGISWLASKIQPDRFPGSNTEQQAMEFFVHMYGMSQATFEQQILPRLTGDVE
jgi:iron complex transport system substrate-binding protein